MLLERADLRAASTHFSCDYNPLLTLAATLAGTRTDSRALLARVGSFRKTLENLAMSNEQQKPGQQQQGGQKPGQQGGGQQKPGQQQQQGGQKPGQQGGGQQKPAQPNQGDE
jgi:hypothetical protein